MGKMRFTEIAFQKGVWVQSRLAVTERERASKRRKGRKRGREGGRKGDH